MKSEEELLDLIDKLDIKVDEINDNIDELQARMPDLEDVAKDRAIMQVEGLKRERVRINGIINEHMKALKELKWIPGQPK